MPEFDDEFIIVQPVWVVAPIGRPHSKPIDSADRLIKIDAARGDVAGSFIAVLTDRDQAERLIDSMIAAG